MNKGSINWAYLVGWLKVTVVLAVLWVAMCMAWGPAVKAHSDFAAWMDTRAVKAEVDRIERKAAFDAAVQKEQGFRSCSKAADPSLDCLILGIK